MANPRIEDLRKRLEKEPGSRLFAQLAEELRKEGELAEAIRVCREGLQKQPNYPSAHITLGRALFDNGDLAGARAEFDAVLRGAPDNILASRLLGECLERLGDAQGALARFKTTLALAPGDRQVTTRIQALEQGSTTRVTAAVVASADATLIMPPPVEGPPPPAPPQAWPSTADVTQPGLAAGVVGAGPAGAEVVPEPPAIPVAERAEEAFELERPYEARTLIGLATPPPTAEIEESFELERRYQPPEAAPAAHRVPAAASVPASSETTLAAAPEVNFDFDGGTVEPIQAWQAPPARFTPESAEPAPESARPAPSAAELEMSTATLAELYLSQGVLDKAVEVYRQLLEREPGNERARTRLGEIQALDGQLREEEVRAAAEGMAPPTPGASRRQAIERTIARLEALLAALKRN